MSGESLVTGSGVAQSANLSQRGQNLRLRVSVLGFTVALGVNVILFRVEADPLWRLLTFFPFVFAFSGALQGLLRTCPMHAFEGKRELDRGGVLPMIDERARVVSRKLGYSVLGGTLALASLATLVIFVLP